MNFDSDYAMTIGGERVVGQSRFEVLNPATEQVIGEAPDCSRDELDAAVAAARDAFPGWSALPIDARRKALIDLATAIEAQVDPLKRLLTSEQGKPHDDAAGEVYAAGWWLRGAASLELPVTVVEDSAERRVETRHVPIGVVGALAPWNFPLALAMFKVGPALLAGNTMVLKPSPFTPLTTLRFGEIAAAILPPGVLNVVSGGDALGPWLTEHPGIDKVSFTGSTATGRRVMASAAPTLKRITLELGGNDAAIVMPDADVAAVAEDLFWAAFRNNGQICIATKRMYVHDDIYDEVKDALLAYAATVKIGDGSMQGTQIGPINNRPQFDRVKDLIEDCRVRGYAMQSAGSVAGPGYFLPLTIVDNPPETARIVREEQFGPVLPLLRFSDLDDAVARANATDYGLGGSVWGSDEAAAIAVAERISSGTVWVNDSQYLSPLAAFGGTGQSGLGVEGGADGLVGYTNTKTVIVRHRPARN